MLLEPRLSKLSIQSAGTIRELGVRRLQSIRTGVKDRVRVLTTFPSVSLTTHWIRFPLGLTVE